MFFFLSGVSSYFALFKRTEQQYRDERVHRCGRIHVIGITTNHTISVYFLVRLLVPFLVLALLNGVYSVSYLAPLTPNCEASFHGENSSAVLAWSHCETYWQKTENSTFPQYLAQHYGGYGPNSGQGWFLLYLFVYSQVVLYSVQPLQVPCRCWPTCLFCGTPATPPHPCPVVDGPPAAPSLPHSLSR